MLYHLLYPYRDIFSLFNVLRYLTFRSMAAFILAFLLVLFLQPYFIKWVKTRSLSQPIRDDGPKTHLDKKGTPTMGGVVVVLGVVLSTLFFANLTNIYIWAVIGITLSYAGLGFIDDFEKIRESNSKGVTAKTKLAWQIFFAAVFIILLMLLEPNFSTSINVPFFKSINIELGWFFLPFAVLVVVGCSNAVNLTDGLDGLVIGPIMTVAFTYGVFSYVAGHSKIADYLQISYVAGSGDLAIFAASIVAGGLGFLWFNSFPAQVFMGDVGSLSLGGALGMLAIITKQELILIVAGGVFVIEAVSVIAQVFSYKIFKKRVFKMAPIHHHYELKGLAEPKIIVRMWIVSIVLALIALATLKLR